MTMRLSRQQKWDLRYLRLAKEAATWSKDPSTKVGAVTVDREGDVIAVTFNGLPRGVADSIERLADRDVKYRMIEHAERNGMRVANKGGGDTVGATVYTYPLPPCAPCAAHLLQHGVSRIVSVTARPEDEALVKRWQEDFSLANTMYQERNVELVLYFPEFLEMRDDFYPGD